MAARVGRLKRRPDFLRVAAARRKFAAPGLVLQVAPRGGDDVRPARNDAPGDTKPGSDAGDLKAADLRVGFTASRKVGNAVVRNRARRRLKALVAEIFPDHAKTQRDYVVIARQAAFDRPYHLLRGDLEAALRRLGAWREQPDGEGERSPRS